MSEPINVIEIRKASNGFVISAWMSDPYRSDRGSMARGYATYVCGDDPSEVAKTVETALREHAITLDVAIPPARELP
jgi:hypothetical protein